MKNVDYDKLIPKGVIFNLKNIEEMNLLKISTAKKLIQQGEITIIKVGNKIHISRTELIQFLEKNTIYNGNAND